MSAGKPLSTKVGQIVKTDDKYEYVVTELGPTLLFKVHYEKLESNFDELVSAENIRVKNEGKFVTNRTPRSSTVPFVSVGDDVESLLFNEWHSATIIGTQFGDFKITCYKKGTKDEQFSEWISQGNSNPPPKNEKKEVEKPIKEPPKEPIENNQSIQNVEKLPSLQEMMQDSVCQELKTRTDNLVTEEKWDEILDKIRSTFNKPKWDGTPVGEDGYHVYLLSCKFDRTFTSDFVKLMKSAGLKVTTNENHLHKARVLLLLYTDNASYDEKLVRLLTRGAELANWGELCIMVSVHPTCSLFALNKIPDNIAYSLADSTWYNWLGVDSPNESFNEMIHQIKSFTCEHSLDVNRSTTMAGLWYCKYVVSGDYCSNFYDNRTFTIYLNDNDGRIYGTTPSGFIFEGTWDKKFRVIDLVGIYRGHWKQENEGWEEDYLTSIIRIKGVLHYKGDRFEGQICELTKSNGNITECVGTIMGKLESQGMSGFYQIEDQIGAMNGLKTNMAIVHKKGGELLCDIKGFHGTMYAGVMDVANRQFWIYVQSGPHTCTTYEGSLELRAEDNTMQITGHFFKCENGITTVPLIKFSGKSLLPTGLLKNQKIAPRCELDDMIANAEQRTLQSAIINSKIFVPPRDEDYATVIVGDEQDEKIMSELCDNLKRFGVAPLSYEKEDISKARTICLILSTNICDNENLINTIKEIALQNLPLFIIGLQARRVIFGDGCWKNIDLKEKLLNCLARLKQTGKLTLDPASLLFQTLVNEIKSNYKKPSYFLSGMWSVRLIQQNEPQSDYLKAVEDAAKNRSKVNKSPKLVYILCDGATGSIVGINDFLSNKPFEGKLDPCAATFAFDNKDSRYELMVESDGQSMQGTYTNRVHGYTSEVVLTIEADEVSGVYNVVGQKLFIGLVKTGHQTLDVHYNNYVLPGVYAGNIFYFTIPRCIRRKPMLSTVCGVLQKSVSGVTIICFEYASTGGMKCLNYNLELLQSKFQKLDESDKCNVECEPSAYEVIQQYVDAFNDIDYELYKDMHADKMIEAEEQFSMYCHTSHDVRGKIKSFDFVGKRLMTEKSLSHLEITRYEFDITYTHRTRREFFILDENCKIKGILSLEEEAQQFHSSIYDVMITYRSTDGGWADFLQLYLENNEILCWRDQRMEIGANWSADITSAIRLAKCELCLLSEEYLRSEMCTKEINLAYESGKTIIPIVLPYTDQTKKYPLVKTTYKLPYPPHQIGHETSQSSWIDFRPSSSDVDPENLQDFNEIYEIPLSILLDRLKLAKSRFHICDLNGTWIISNRNNAGIVIMTKVILEHKGRIATGILQEGSGKPIARLSTQSIIQGTRMILYFVNPRTHQLVLGIKAMMAGDNR